MLKVKNLFFLKEIRCAHLETSVLKPQPSFNHITLSNQHYLKDEFTNITEKIVTHLNRNIYLQPYHPLNLVKQRIVKYFYKTFVNKRGNAVFSVHDNLSPVVSTYQNFDSLLIEKDHPSRAKSDCYYINKSYLLRAHMTAHQSELIQLGLNNFLMIGDVYRRDEIDRTHYPVFHQIDAVKLNTCEQVFCKDEGLHIFEEGNNTAFTGIQEKQACHSLEAVKLVEHELKDTLVGLTKYLFGVNAQYRWVDTYFPFTQPSWELEVFHNDQWLELLGCGIMNQSILSNAGVNNKIGWALGLGIERIAMCLYRIPDIRLFWSTDSGFLNQFKTDNLNEDIIYVPISQYPQLLNDISFWIPESDFSPNDFYEIARTIGGDLIEQVTLIDNFKHPKTGKVSHCYRITYRHMERTLTQEEISVIHKRIEANIVKHGGIVR